MSLSAAGGCNDDNENEDEGEDEDEDEEDAGCAAARTCAPIVKQTGVRFSIGTEMRQCSYSMGKRWREHGPVRGVHP